MPPKVSKKAVEKAQKKVIEDKTFGLKNKNRSAKVQKAVAQFEASVMSGNREQQKKAAELAQKKSAKEAKAEFEAEMQRLFKVAEDKRKAEEKAAAAAAAAAGEDGAPVLGPDGEYLWTADDFEEVAHEEGRLEEQLEAEREALKGRTDLTPVTEETFRAWRQRKIQEAEDAEKARLRKAKETGKLRGWDLWQENADLFVDDEEAEGEYERELDEADYDLGDDEGDATAASPKHVDPAAAA